jgi:hypothetical protein
MWKMCGLLKCHPRDEDHYMAYYPRPLAHGLSVAHIHADDSHVFYGRLEHTFLFHVHWREMFGVQLWNNFLSCWIRKALVNGKQWVFDFLQWESETNAMVSNVTCWHIW